MTSLDMYWILRSQVLDFGVCVCVCGCIHVICIVVMRFMGDTPSRGLTEQEVVSTFLKVKPTVFFSLGPHSVFDNLLICDCLLVCLCAWVCVCVCVVSTAHRRVHLDEG